MTIPYRCFGVPRTFEEFVDKVASSDRVHGIEIKPVAYSDLSFGGRLSRFIGIPDGDDLFLNYHRGVVLRAGKTRLRMYQESGPLESSGEGRQSHMTRIRDEVLAQARDIAGKLKGTQSDLKVTVIDTI